MALSFSLKTPKYDCALGAPDNENARTLTLTLRLALYMLDPLPQADKIKDHTGRRFPIIPWTQDDFRIYANKLKTSVEQVWNDRIYILLPDPNDPRVALSKVDYEMLQHPDKKIRAKSPPFIKCALEVKTQAEEVGSHGVFHIARLQPGQPMFGSFTHAKTRSGKERNLLTDQDVEVRERSEEKGLYYHTASHEVGHILGLKHINRQAAGCVEGNEEICYGGSPYQARDIMGKGMAVDADSAAPWLGAIRALTQHNEGWTATHLSPPIEKLLDDAIRSARSR